MSNSNPSIEQQLLNQAAEVICSSPDLAQQVLFGDDEVMHVLTPLELQLELQEGEKTIVLPAGQYQLAQDGREGVAFAAQADRKTNPLFLEGVVDLNVEDGKIILVPTALPETESATDSVERSSSSRESSGMGDVCLLIVLAFVGFIVLAPPLLGFLLQGMTRGAEKVDEAALCNAAIRQEVIVPARAEMRVSGGSGNFSVTETPMVTTQNGTMYLAIGDACSEAGLKPGGILYQFGQIGDVPYFVQTRHVSMLGESLPNIESAMPLTEAQADQVVQRLGEQGSVSDADLADIQANF